MLVACVKTGSKYSSDYVTKLRNGVARHLHVKHDFVCFTDNSVEGVRCEPLPVPLPTWWSKIGLFKLREPMVYLDLDTVITGDLQRLADWEGFGILADPMGGLGSGIMKLTGNEGEVWEKFHPAVMQQMRGDQDWITKCMPDAPTFPKAWFPSFKFDNCIKGVPEGAMACSFHGLPKMHQITSGWVKDAWV